MTQKPWRPNQLEDLLLKASEVAPAAGGIYGTVVGGVLGTIFPGLGTAVGAGIGGTLGAGAGTAAKVLGDQYEASNIRQAEDRLTAQQDQQIKMQDQILKRAARRQAAMQLIGNFL